MPMSGKRLKATLKPGGTQRNSEESSGTFRGFRKIREFSAKQNPFLCFLNFSYKFFITERTEFYNTNFDWLIYKDRKLMPENIFFCVNI